MTWINLDERDLAGDESLEVAGVESVLTLTGRRVISCQSTKERGRRGERGEALLCMCSLLGSTRSGLEVGGIIDPSDTSSGRDQRQVRG